MAVARILNYDENDISSEHYITQMPCKKLSSDKREQVLDYLINDDFKSFANTEEPFNDPWTGLPLWNFGRTYSDGKFIWDDKLPFYVRDHDLMLPEDFIEHVEKFYEQGGETRPLFDWRTERFPPRRIGRTKTH